MQGLRSSLDGLKAAYFSPEDMEHIHSHDHKDGGHKEGEHK